jgi:hypothetical protein
MAQSIVALLVQQEGDKPAHYEIWQQPDAHFFGSDGDAMREIHTAQQRTQAAREQAAYEYQVLCKRWQAGLEAYIEHCERMSANILAVQSAADVWIRVHPFPKPPAILRAKPVSIFNAAYRA